VARHAQDLAVVEGFELRQRVGVALDQVGQTQQQPLALDRADRGPGPLVEGEAGGLHGGVDIGPVGHGRLRHHGPGGGIDHRHVPALSRNERAVHQHAQRLRQKITRLRIRADHVDHITHVRCCPLESFRLSGGQHWESDAQRLSAIGTSRIDCVTCFAKSCPSRPEGQAALDTRSQLRPPCDFHATDSAAPQ
jgi:hypothetical protein